MVLSPLPVVNIGELTVQTPCAYSEYVPLASGNVPSLRTERPASAIGNAHVAVGPPGRAAAFTCGPATSSGDRDESQALRTATATTASVRRDDMAGLLSWVADVDRTH